MIPLVGVLLVVLATIALGIYAKQLSKTAADFFVASRSVGVMMNASAISGEYLSAASFMGVAGLIMKNGYDALWYPVGYAAGYLFLLLFIAGPLRRFGAYTIPDFAEGRFDSPGFRKLAVLIVLIIGFFYTMPQMKAAGVTMGAILGWPYWVGIVVVGAVISFNVALGGMKGITLVQSFQYWVKMFAICAPLFVLMAVFGSYSGAVGQNADDLRGSPEMKQGAEISVKGKEAAPANTLVFTPETAILEFPEGAKIMKISPSRKPEPGEEPIPPGQLAMIFRGGTDGMTGRTRVTTDHIELPPGGKLMVRGTVVMKNHLRLLDEHYRVVSTGPKLEFETPTKMTISSFVAGGTTGSIAPNAPTNAKWLNPYGTLTSKWGYPVLYTFSLIIALVCGTAGLPHILVRFYTNPDGRSARKTTFWVMVLLGAFYVFTPIWGALGRAFSPELYASTQTDVVVLKLPTLIENKMLGEILGAITAAGAFAAFMSTFSGLLVSMSGAFAHDIYGKILRPTSTPDQQRRAFQIAAIGVGAASMLLGYFVEQFDIAMMVGWAFAIGAASYFPLLLLGSWWKGLTAKGAATGMLVGGLLSLAAIVGHMLLDKKVLTMELPPIVRALMEQPAIWGVPLALITMILVSKATAKEIPPDVTLKMLRLHAPESLGYSKNYVD